ncbi:DoxX family protein [Gephyromycinifex aptenodytis]|uniref:DoxX family protein n=1 Tax=Gephyromycinifex aptenodytis TaxID=2716227 RepID=UPI00144639DC|nr:DoxX family membrane protein [Gephyromycinifex aptenodytis]
MNREPERIPFSQNITRLLLGAVMTFAGVSHLTTARAEFQAQVPAWFPLDADFVVIASGVVEIVLGAGLLLLPRYRRIFGVALAVFYVLIFPGNIAQYLEHTDAFGLDTDAKRLVRLFFQPLLVLAALWAAGVLPRRPDARAHRAP